ncbi:hypothetical protein D9M69_528280 [compost metagenome]
MHEGIAGHAEGLHGAIDLLEERPQAIVGRHAERRVAHLAPTIQPHRRHEGLGRIGIRSEDEELQFGGHHGLPAVGRITLHHLAQQAPGRQPGRTAIQLLGIANGQGTRPLAPGQAMDLTGFRDQGQVAVVAAIEACRRVTAHDALQQHAPRQLQAAPGEEALSRHHLAPHHPIQVGGDALDLFNAGQSLRERAADFGSHDSCPCALRPLWMAACTKYAPAVRDIKQARMEFSWT